MLVIFILSHFYSSTEVEVEKYTVFFPPPLFLHIQIMIPTNNRKNSADNIIYFICINSYIFSTLIRCMKTKLHQKITNTFFFFLQKLYFVCQAFTTVVSINMYATTQINIVNWNYFPPFSVHSLYAPA